MITPSFIQVKPHAFVWISVAFILQALVIFIWKRRFNIKIGLKNYESIQRIHQDEIPRLGGLIALICFFGYSLSLEDSEMHHLLNILLLCIGPISFIALKEDLFHNVEPAIRLMALLFSAWLFRALYLGSYPDMSSVPFVRDLILMQGGLSFFYILSIATIANGINLIDGVNGLASGVIISILGALLFLGFKVHDPLIFGTTFLLLLFILPYALLNFPKGRIFLGDLGAYALGIMTSILTIILIGRHPELSPFNAALIMIYPATEVIFSIARRILKGESIFKPDLMHLHNKIFLYLTLKKRFSAPSKNLVTIFLSPLWLLPLWGVIFFYEQPEMLIASIALFCMGYLSLFTLLGYVKRK
jgi:UDP-N-acetylmuramyl pentapeptide phosphotransferase/UDP-N-acetylglucosamine-1-phosphate transferase